MLLSSKLAAIRIRKYLEATMSAAEDPPFEEKTAESAASPEQDEVPSARTRNAAHANLDSATRKLSRARRFHELLRFTVSVSGALVAWGFLHASLTGSGDVPKLEEAFGSALLFASIAGIATTVVRFVSRVGQREIAVLQRDSELRKQENELLSTEFDRIGKGPTDLRVE
jgi:hypothetical protein